MPGEKMPEEERREAILRAAFRVASRDKLRGLSVRAVAEEAEVSKGLIFFHFQDKDTLLMALLDWLLEGGPRVAVPPEVSKDPDTGPVRRLLRLVRYQIAELPERRERVELFLDFWVMGRSHGDAKGRIRGAFERYRREFEPYTRPVVEEHPEAFEGDGAQGLSAVIVSFIQGCALQLIADPDGFDADRYMRAVTGLVRR